MPPARVETAMRSRTVVLPPGAAPGTSAAADLARRQPGCSRTLTLPNFRLTPPAPVARTLLFTQPAPQARRTPQTSLPITISTSADVPAPPHRLFGPTTPAGRSQ